MAGIDPASDASPPDTSDPRHRAVRSFVLRQGRMTAAQARAFEEHWQRYGLVAGDAPLDLDAVFGRRARRVLEIGFGNGEALCEATQAEPGTDFIGIEVHGPGVGRLLKDAAAAGVGNLRVFQHDAIEVLDRAIPAHSIDELRLFFPDPWPKKKHHKRRIVQPAFAERVRRVLVPGGRLHMATDWPHYAEHMLEVMGAAPGWRNSAGAGHYSERPASRTLTHFEKRGLRLGHPVHDLIYETLTT
jgi:tRNA (guanine-N7-)-methyltransferase